jgi:hypothetical protein
MTPDGQVAHVVEVSSDGVRFEARARYEGAMSEGGVFGVTLSPAALARYLRVRTERSPSWVAWNEIVPVACAGERATPPASPTSSEPPTMLGPSARPTPPPRLVPGVGACAHDADCHPNGNCHPTGCTSRPVAPSGLACTRSCSGPLDCDNGECVCNRGRCTMSTRGTPDEQFHEPLR